MVTISAIKADIGGYPGHRGMHPDLVTLANKELGIALKNKLLIDFRVLACGDDLQLIMTHNKGVDCEEIHELAWDTFIKISCVFETSHLSKALFFEVMRK